MLLRPIVFIENPTENDHGAIYHDMNKYTAERGLSGTGGYFFAIYVE